MTSLALKEFADKVRIYLLGRKRAYQMVFHVDNQFTNAVLADLAKFCRADQSTFNPDPRIHAVLEGRREVFLRIANHLRLSPDELYSLYAKKDGPQ